MTKTEKNYAISLLRVIGMFSIVFCHFFGWLNIQFLSQFLNFGVYLFLFISGYLYANKDIQNYGEWILSRIKKLIIPFYLFSIPVMIIYFCSNTIDIVEIVKYMFCLQGINFIISGVPFSEIPPLGNLWFITVILFCYLLTIPVKKFEKKHKPNKLPIILILITAFALTSILQYFSIPHISLTVFITYFIGYYAAKFMVKNTAKVFTVFGIILFVFAIGLRLAGKQYLDENFQEEYQLLITFTHPATAISFYFIVAYLTNKCKLFVDVAKSRCWNVLDKYSYFIYITHYAFLNSVTSVDNFEVSKLFSIVLFILFTVGSALLIYIINNWIQKRFSNAIR